MKYCVVLLSALLLLIACSSEAEREATAVHNDTAYRLRYSDIDLSCQAARHALAESPEGSEAWSEAMNNMAYVAYQQMRFDQALHLLHKLHRSSRNQLELLCADVLEIKVMQRIGQGKDFFDSRLRAQRRLHRILGELETLTPRQQHRLLFAQSELHIVASTYYYYIGQDSLSRQEIGEAAGCIDLGTDTVQWLYYHYMLGSGGLVDGTPEEVTLTEFDHLFRTYTLAKARGVRYFQANALQSLASMVADSLRSDCLKQQRIDAYTYLYAEHLRYQADSTLTPRFQMAVAMANHAIELFRQYKDVFQTACALRTLGEVYFADGHYEVALDAFRTALHLTESHRRSSHQVTPWLAGIHENLSLTYSALGDKKNADSHRTAYLDLLDLSRQNRELDSRKAELAQQVRWERLQFAMLLVLVVLVVVLSVAYYRQLARHSRTSEQRMCDVASSEVCLQAMHRLHDIEEERHESLDEQRELCEATRQNIQAQQQRHILQRTKLSVVYAIIPYLDRVIAEVRHLGQGGGETDAQRLTYIQELCAGMMAINDRLTEWIQMQQGRLRLHVTRFPLSEVLDVIRMQQYAFAQKKLTLQVPDTDVLVKADKPLTLFMINTLADNARKFTPEGGTVSVEVRPTEEYVEIAICDTGIGLSPEDVDTLNGSKVYDSSHLGLSADGKGFGFGIMNCKGIIGSYKKLSSLFNVCDFGVESQAGQGSRFWFRLPRVLSLLVAMLFAAGSIPSLAQGAGQPAAVYALFDSTYTANIEGRHAEACLFADQALQQMEEPIDTPLLVSLYNEQAIAAQAMGWWDVYRQSNAECVRLHRLYSTDATLASDCQRLERMAADSKVSYVLIVLLFVASLALFYRVMLRGRLRHRASLDGDYQRVMAALQGLPDNEAVFSQEIHAIAASMTHPQMRQAVQQLRISVEAQLATNAATAADIERAEEAGQKLSFEHDRLYVMNQILDNALSTIKHETMYFPSRIKQMADAMQQQGVDGQMQQNLQELVTYYRQIYMLLYEQAQRQTDQSGLRRQHIPLAELFAHAAQQYGAAAEPTEAIVLGDRMLLQLLFDQLFSAIQGEAVLSASGQDGMVTIRCQVGGEVLSDEQLTALFTPMTDRLPCLVVRQILRQHDAACGHPGLRLNAERTADGYAILLTLKGG